MYKSNNKSMQSGAISGRIRCSNLDLLEKTNIVTAATVPQLRNRRQFQFNGMHFKTNPLLLRRSRAGLDGDAGDARFAIEVTQEQRDCHHLGHNEARASSSLQAVAFGETNVNSAPRTQQHIAGNNSQQIAELMSYDNVRAGGENAHDNNNCNSNKDRYQQAHDYGNHRIILNNNNSNLDNNNNAEDNRNHNEHNQAQQQRPISSRIASKLHRFRYGHLRGAGGAPNAAGVGQQPKVDYITLAGFLLGYLISNILFFICCYFSWLKVRVMRLRNHFLGQANLWEFFDFEDTTRYSMQTKLLLAPIILGCSILYCIVNILHLMIKLVRSDVPRTVVEFVQRIALRNIQF
ncbi:uncharacterized membrane protein DDB_G0293934 [Drosophila grimshawi]|uniref:uncharacterized membrane protein DDB_G0293934 n=1 Tax=Drosophila grimshawi TaxID=7222 RepID=UPI000C86E60E|nr:uncharacterized membrane protein DDB_G0293934 [Drosophila grimshawi]